MLKFMSLIEYISVVTTWHLPFLLVQMLSIHERYVCGVPVIIEGETGVGKTALISMLSKLWNHALFDEWRTIKKNIIETLYKKSLGKTVNYYS